MRANIVLLVQGLMLTHISIPTPVSTTVRVPYLTVGSVTATAAAHFIVMKISEKQAGAELCQAQIRFGLVSIGMS